MHPGDSLFVPDEAVDVLSHTCRRAVDEDLQPSTTRAPSLRAMQFPSTKRSSAPTPAGSTMGG